MAIVLSDYLAKLDEPRREYARRYAEWLAADEGERPKPEGMRRETAALVRRRVEELAHGRHFDPLSPIV